MDPNANLEEQEYQLSKLHAYGQKVDRKRLRELREALLDWMHHGGFEPDWAACPKATKAFNAWRIKTIGY